MPCPECTDVVLSWGKDKKFAIGKWKAPKEAVQVQVSLMQGDPEGEESHEIEWQVTLAATASPHKFKPFALRDGWKCWFEIVSICANCTMSEVVTSNDLT